MPKKTRKQKKQADTRHLSTTVVRENAMTFSFEATASPAETKRHIEQISELTAIRHDIVRTLVLAAIAFFVEIAVYWRFYR